MSRDAGGRRIRLGQGPLPTGPVPLTLRQAYAATAIILAGTLLIGSGLPVLARSIAGLAVPPVAIVFGTAAMIPADGWEVTDTTEVSVRLTRGGVWLQMTSLDAEGKSATARVLDLVDDMQEAYPTLTVASQPRPFFTPTNAQGQLTALAGTTQTALVASVVGGGQAVDVSSLGESTQFGDAVSDIEEMIESIRLLGVTDEG